MLCACLPNSKNMVKTLSHSDQFFILASAALPNRHGLILKWVKRAGTAMYHFSPISKLLFCLFYTPPPIFWEGGSGRPVLPGRGRVCLIHNGHCRDMLRCEIVVQHPNGDLYLHPSFRASYCCPSSRPFVKTTHCDWPTPPRPSQPPWDPIRHASNYDAAKTVPPTEMRIGVNWPCRFLARRPTCWASLFRIWMMFTERQMQPVFPFLFGSSLYL